MNIRTRILQALVVATVFVVGGYAWGQREDETNVRSTKDIEAEFNEASPEERLELSQGRIETMQNSVEATDERADKVRSEERDIEKLNCINEKLAAMRGFLKVSEQSYGKLREAMDAADVQAQQHRFTLIAIAQDKTRNLEEEALQCAGEVLQYAGDSTVTTTVDPNIADIDPVEPYDMSYFDEYVEERLAELTPYQ